MKIDKQETPITLTNAAAAHIHDELVKSMQSGDTIIGLKLAIKVSGCSGYSYVLGWVNSSDDINDYKVFVSHEIKIFVDKMSYQYIAGTEIDYVQQGISKVMVFHNPNATAECGCGESFTIDKDKS